MLFPCCMCVFLCIPLLTFECLNLYYETWYVYGADKIWKHEEFKEQNLCWLYLKNFSWQH
jgi:hypothetical protein